VPPPVCGARENRGSSDATTNTNFTVRPQRPKPGLRRDGCAIHSSPDRDEPRFRRCDLVWQDRFQIRQTRVSPPSMRRISSRSIQTSSPFIPCRRSPEDCAYPPNDVHHGWPFLGWLVFNNLIYELSWPAHVRSSRGYISERRCFKFEGLYVGNLPGYYHSVPPGQKSRPRMSPHHHGAGFTKVPTESASQARQRSTYFSGRYLVSRLRPHSVVR